MQNPIGEALAYLKRSGIEVDSSKRRRGEYSSDSSNYRVVPEAVAFPRNADELALIAEASRKHEMPLTARGAGTSVAGNAIGPGLVFDTSRYFNKILDLDAEAGTARVEPGVILAQLQRAAGPLGLRFGPDPSTATRCTIGGMIGNNACGPRALHYGKTSDNVVGLSFIDGRGRVFDTSRMEGLPASLESLMQSELTTIRTEFGRFARQVSGYSLEHLLPENRRNLTKTMVGTEGTCGLFTEATVKLVEPPRDPLLIVLGFRSMVAAAHSVPQLLRYRPIAIESLDRRLLDSVLAHSAGIRVPELPAGDGWLFVEIDQAAVADVGAMLKSLIADSGTSHVKIVTLEDEAKALWRIRADGVGLAGRTAAGLQAWPGLEDAAVPPEHLGAYLTEFDELCAGYGVEGMPFGHFGDGCIHVRLSFPLEHDGEVLHDFMHDAARLITRFGGSLSGEHGDGRARSELLQYMYSPHALTVMSRFKDEFDPQNLLNPGVLVNPLPLTSDLRRPQAAPIFSSALALHADSGSLTKAAHRCVGVGKCRADNAENGGFMCPSYQASKDEKDSTRARARVLQEAANGTFIGGLASPEVADSLDLCLSCKACSRECPAGVDMAALKAEVQYQTYRGRLRPISHYTLGWLPRWAKFSSPAAPIANALLRIPGVETLVLKLGGMDTRRKIPKFKRSFTASKSVAAARSSVPATGDAVVLWADSFSNHFAPDIMSETMELLERAGYRVIIPAPVCCGLTWISTGQLDGAKRRLSDLLDVLAPFAEQGVPILGLEPSCTAVIRSDLLELLPDDPRSKLVAERTRTLAELLRHRTKTHEQIDLSGTRVLVQPHCHQYSVMGFDTDVELMRMLGAEVETLAGCCGLAGNFGMEAGHYETSVAIAENALLPALRSMAKTTVFLADGLSCRTQAEDLGATDGLHLAQLLRRAMR
ncbi:MAG: FAD-linked oxidase C-terminal domain-containing protein [Microterricola sp.]